MSQDKYLILCDDLDISGVDTTETTSSNVFQIDGTRIFSEASTGDPILLNASVDDVYKGGSATLYIGVGTTGWYTAGAAGIVQIRWYEHTAAAVASGTAVVAMDFNAVPLTTNAAPFLPGSMLARVQLAPGYWGDATNYFIGLSAYIDGQTLTAGTLNAWLELG